MSLGPEAIAAARGMLASLSEGFGPPMLVAGRGGVWFGREAKLRVPEGARGLFLEIDLPPGVESLRYTLQTPEGVELAAIDAREEASWLVASLDGQRELRLAASGSVEAPPLVAGSMDAVSGLLRDLEFLRHPVRDRAPISGREGRFLTVRMDLTNKCNLRCRMCALSFDEVFYQAKDYMSVETFEDFAKVVLPKVAQLTLSAGYEPLLHPRFADVLKIVADHEVPHVEFVTNGTLLDEKLMHVLIDTKVTQVTFSVDGSTAETYEHVRRGADFERFQRGLALFARVKEERGAVLPKMTFNMTLMGRNVAELPDVIRLGARHGLETMMTAIMIPHAGLGMEPEALQHHRELANEAFASARAVAKELGVTAQIPADFDLARPAETVEWLPVGPEYTLAEEWGRGRKVELSTTAGDDEGEFAPEALPERSAAVEEKESVVPEGIPEDQILPLPPAETLPAPKSYDAADAGPTMVSPGSAAWNHEALDEAGKAVPTACVYPWTMAILRPDGHLTPCCHWHELDTLGSLHERSFEELWNGEAYRRLRTGLQVGRFRPSCLHCPERKPI